MHLENPCCQSRAEEHTEHRDPWAKIKMPTVERGNASHQSSASLFQRRQFSLLHTVHTVLGSAFLGDDLKFKVRSWTVVAEYDDGTCPLGSSETRNPNGIHQGHEVGRVIVAHSHTRHCCSSLVIVMLTLLLQSFDLRQ
jgi:hypothetical protein